MKRLLNGLSIVFSFGFTGMRSVLECLDLRGFVAELAVHMVTPIVIAIFILLVGLARMLQQRTGAPTAAALLEITAPYLLKLLFIAYPLVTTVAFDAFPCYLLQESEWLKFDVSIECGTPEHDDAKALAWVAILLCACIL